MDPDTFVCIKNCMMHQPNIITGTFPWAFYLSFFITTGPLFIFYLKIEASLVTLQYQVTVSESVFLYHQGDHFHLF